MNFCYIFFIGPCLGGHSSSDGLRVGLRVRGRLARVLLPCRLRARFPSRFRPGAEGLVADRFGGRVEGETKIGGLYRSTRRCGRCTAQLQRSVTDTPPRLPSRRRRRRRSVARRIASLSSNVARVRCPLSARFFRRFLFFICYPRVRIGFIRVCRFVSVRLDFRVISECLAVRLFSVRLVAMFTT